MTEERDRAFLTEDELETSGELTDTEVYQGELETGEDAQHLVGLTETELREGETADPNVAAEEGLTWVAPIDPPVVPDADNPEGIQVAAGFGADADSEPFDADHHSELLTSEDELGSRIREALRANSATSRYADDIVIGTRNGTVVVRGMVDDIDDTDNVAEVISTVAGVAEVVEELEVAGVTTD
jgi:hypothetical protein